MPNVIRLHKGRVVLIRGDNSAWGGKADAIVSDPPYGINYCSGKITKSSISSTGKRFSRRILGDAAPFDPNKWLDYPQVALTGAQHYYDKLPAGGSFHCWDKRGNYKPLDQADGDLVWIKSPSRKSRSIRIFHLVWRGICRHSENREKILHPTQKPIALMEWIIGLCNLPPDSLICDPYMGVGTTAIAALNLGHRFIGIELDKEYFSHAVSRIEAL